MSGCDILYDASVKVYSAYNLYKIVVKINL